MKILQHKIKTVNDLKPYIHDDSKLTIAIKQLTDNVEDFKIEHYKELRKMAYPDISELADIMVKEQSSVDVSEQKGKYVQDCLDVKERFKKTKEV